MSVSGEPGHIHPIPTRRSGHRYFFYNKHHGWGGPKAARWSMELGEEQEFGIFNQADELDIRDAQGNLYGVWRVGEDLRALGTRGQQIAKFPRAHPGQPWHGFPSFPLRDETEPHPPVRFPPREVFERMERTGAIDRLDRKRFEKAR